MLPPTLHNLTTEQAIRIEAEVRDAFLAEAELMKIDQSLGQDLVDIYIPLAATLTQNARAHKRSLVVGVNGAQGAGKSTLCRLLQQVLEQGFEQRVAILSIDDLYLTRAERCRLAGEVHPLLMTRGVPGTHDVALGLQLIDDLRSLAAGEQLSLPQFDKAVDDRRPRQQWPELTGPIDLVLFEGWCVGARPEAEESLTEPVNRLERDEDTDMSWRRFVNRQLQHDYARLYAEIDFLVMMKVPGMESVLSWRSLQEQKLASVTDQSDHHKIMDAEALRRFIMHYERLTRNLLQEMPDRADLVLELNAEHQIDGVRINTLALTGES